jgi:hypothetical protein
VGPKIWEDITLRWILVWVDIGYVGECGSRWMWVSVGPLVCGSNSVGDTQGPRQYTLVTM